MLRTVAGVLRGGNLRQRVARVVAMEDPVRILIVVLICLMLPTLVGWLWINNEEL